MEKRKTPDKKAQKLLFRSSGSSSFNTFNMIPPDKKAITDSNIRGEIFVMKPTPQPAKIEKDKIHLPL